MNLKVMSNQPGTPDQHPRKSSTGERYSATQSDAHLHIAVSGQQVDLAKLNRMSNLISAKQDRPIVVLNFNPHKSTLIVPAENPATQTLRTNSYTFLNFNITTHQNVQVPVYVLEQYYPPLTKPVFLSAKGS